jgi:hypothetical protein
MDPDDGSDGAAAFPSTLTTTLRHEGNPAMASSLVQYNEKCPVLIIADTRKPVNQGFGARVTFLMWAADIALKIGGVLAVDDKYFSRGGMNTFHFGIDIRWAWRFLPFANATYALRTAPKDMKLMVKPTLTVDRLLKTWECNTAYKLQAGIGHSCNSLVRWCYLRLPGALDRGLRAVTASPSPALQQAVERNAAAFNATSKALAVWHIRTGDIVLPLRRSAATRIKETIDKAFSRRGVRHVVLTFQKKGLDASFPWLATELGMREVYDEKQLNDMKAFDMMLSAQVIVSTGSSFPHIPAGLAGAGRQIHFYFPAKSVNELRDDGVCCIQSECACEKPSKSFKVLLPPSTSSPGLNCSPTVISSDYTAATHEANFNYLTRTHAYWMGSFVRKNTVPVTCSGDIYSEYRFKLRELAAGIDGERGRADASIANLAYEGWMR